MQKGLAVSARELHSHYALISIPHTLGLQAGHNIQGGNTKVLQRNKNTAPPNECSNIPIDS